MDRRSYTQKQQDREILRFGVGPDDLRAGDAAPIAPGVNKIEAEQYPQAQAHQPIEPPLFLVLGIFDDAAVFLGPEIAVRQMVVDANDLAPVPSRLPLAGAEAVTAVLEDMNAAVRAFCNDTSVPNTGASRVRAMPRISPCVSTTEMVTRACEPSGRRICARA